MLNLEEIDEMITYIEENKYYEGMTNNEFFINFFETVDILPLSKYLRHNNKDKRLPKVMNAKKAGEVLKATYKDEDLRLYLKRKGYPEVPELDYRSIMLLRKVDLYTNWNKIIAFLEGKGTVGEINQSTKKVLLPREVDKLEEYIKTSLSIDDKELNWLLAKTKKIQTKKSVARAFKKLLKNI